MGNRKGTRRPDVLDGSGSRGQDSLRTMLKMPPCQTSDSFGLVPISTSRKLDLGACREERVDDAHSTPLRGRMRSQSKAR